MPSAAVGGDGAVTVAWLERGTTGAGVRVARSKDGRSWHRAALSPVGAVPCVDEATCRAAAPAVAALPDGGAVVVWVAVDGAFAATSTATAWGGAAPLALRPDARTPSVVVDVDGAVTAAWRLDGSGAIEVAHATADGAWTPSLTLATSTSPAALTADASGAVTAAWSTGTTVMASRLDDATGTWGPPVTLSTAQGVFAPPDRPGVSVGADESGCVLVAWSEQPIGGSEVVRAARFDAVSAAWQAPVTLATLDFGLVSVQLAVAPSGDAVAAWTGREFWPADVAVRFDAASDAWSAPEVIAANLGRLYSVEPALAIDVHGNAFVTHRGGNRLSASTGQWTLTSEADSRLGGTQPDVVADAAGHATAVWRTPADVNGVAAVVATRWQATPEAPALGAVLPGDASLALTLAPPAAADPAFAASNYEYSLDDGATWTPRVPASTGSPLVVAGLAHGTPYGVRIRAVNIAGAGDPVSFTATPGPEPGPPTGLVVRSVVGNQVTIGWTPPSNSVPPTGYVLEGGVLPSQTLASLPLDGTVPRATFVAPTGAFVIRLRSRAGALHSVSSPEVPLVVGAPVAPSPPADLVGIVGGSTLALSWTNTFGGGAPTRLWLVVEGPVSGALPLPAGETFAHQVAWPGTYRFVVHAANDAGASGPSNPVTLTVPTVCPAVPKAPVGFLVSHVGASVSLSWDPPPDVAITRYQVLVSGSWTGAIETTARALTTTAPPGSYTIRVAAANPCGWGPVTAPVTLVVP